MGATPIEVDPFNAAAIVDVGTGRWRPSGSATAKTDVQPVLLSVFPKVSMVMTTRFEPRQADSLRRIYGSL
jgi:hypothetical protein